MKNVLRLIGIIALVAAIGFTMIACGGGGGGGGSNKGGAGDPTRDPKTFTGTTDGGDTYTLKIEAGTTSGSKNVLDIYDDGSRAVLTPRNGDRYTLTSGGKTSRGTITVNGTTYTLSPTDFPAGTVEADFTVSVSGDNITAMSGVITWTDGTTKETNTFSFTFTPGGSGGGLTITGIPAKYNGKGTYFVAMTDDEKDDGTFTMLLGIQEIKSSGNKATYVLSPISGGRVTIPVLFSATGTSGSAGYKKWTGSDTFDSVIVLILPKTQYAPEELSALFTDMDAVENEEIDLWEFDDVKFTGGNATVSWDGDNSMWDWDDD